MEENSILRDHVTAFLHEHMANSFAYSTTFTLSACKQTKWPPTVPNNQHYFLAYNETRIR